MNYLFIKQDTVLILCFLVYAGFGFIQLQKMLIIKQLGQSFSLYRSIWIVSRTILALPLFLIVKYLI